MNKKMKKPNELPTAGRGSIRADEIVTLREFGRRLGFGVYSDNYFSGLTTIRIPG
jgi:hypothetical protein